jgi:hypothetical protein
MQCFLNGVLVAFTFIFGVLAVLGAIITALAGVIELLDRTYHNTGKALEGIALTVAGALVLLMLAVVFSVSHHFVCINGGHYLAGLKAMWTNGNKQ